MNTYRSVSKQRTLTSFRMNTYEKQGGRVQLLLTRNPTKDFYPERPSGVKDLSSNPTIADSGLAGKDFYPERPSGVKDLSSNPKLADPARPERISTLIAPSPEGRSIPRRESLPLRTASTPTPSECLCV
jgi:hypothetical protein